MDTLLSSKRDSFIYKSSLSIDYFIGPAIIKKSILPGENTLLLKFQNPKFYKLQYNKTKLYLSKNNSDFLHLKSLFAKLTIFYITFYVRNLRKPWNSQGFTRIIDITNLSVQSPLFESFEVCLSIARTFIGHFCMKPHFTWFFPDN